MKLAMAANATPTDQLLQNFNIMMRQDLREITEGTNINKDSLLTTDYLNHYSGMVMLLEQLPETPDELIIYFLSWEPIGYEEHFKTSGFRDGELAILAYHHAPDHIRAMFDAVINRLHDESIKALNLVRAQAEAGDTLGLTKACQASAPILRDLIDEASAIVNQQQNSQTQIDGYF